ARPSALARPSLPCGAPPNPWTAPLSPETEVERVQREDPHRGALVAVRTGRPVVQGRIPLRVGVVLADLPGDMCDRIHIDRHIMCRSHHRRGRPEHTEWIVAGAGEDELPVRLRSR